MLYSITNVTASGIRVFIDSELEYAEIFGLDISFNISICKAPIPRKFLVQVMYIDLTNHNKIHLTSMCLSSRQKAVIFANRICPNSERVTKLNF